jgi:hypothetical protein
MKSTVLVITFLFTVFSWAQEFNGYALYNRSNQSTAYLIDKDGGTAHTWSCTRPCNYTVLLKEDGNIVRGAVHSSNELSGAAIGGLVQEYDPSGDVVWEFVYSNDEHCSHHDIAINPINNSVFLIAWEVKSEAELLAAGYDDPDDEKWPTHIVEVQPDGDGGGEIIWEWHLWDHMIQDIDDTKDNYGVIADHPELMDINAIEEGGGPGGPPGGDWYHVNGIDYNAELDQLVFSSRHTSEIYIIDHSTTTAEAAGHTGGNAGKGGDFLYRWGNPSNYGAPGGAVITAAVHDPRWIQDGRPFEGYIQFFNNSGDGGNSAVDIILPPLSGDGYNYDYTPGEAYLPATFAERHSCEENSSGQSASDRMSNGNVFVAVSGEYMYEVNADGDVIWSYGEGPQKAFRYECDHEGILAVVGDLCGLGIDDNKDLNQITVYPNPSNGLVTISGLSNLTNYSVEVIDLQGRIVYAGANQDLLNLEQLDNGIYTLRISTEKGLFAVEQISLNK